MKRPPRVPKGARAHPNTRKRRDECFAEQNGQCFYCHVRMEKKGEGPRSATLEHRIPLSRGGRHSRVNTVAACGACNTLKGDKTDEEFAFVLAALPRGKDAHALDRLSA